MANENFGSFSVGGGLGGLGGLGRNFGSTLGGAGGGGGSASFFGGGPVGSSIAPASQAGAMVSAPASAYLSLPPDHDLTRVERAALTAMHAAMEAACDVVSSAVATADEAARVAARIAFIETSNVGDAAHRTGAIKVREDAFVNGECGLGDDYGLSAGQTASAIGATFGPLMLLASRMWEARYNKYSLSPDAVLTYDAFVKSYPGRRSLLCGGLDLSSLPDESDENDDNAADASQETGVAEAEEAEGAVAQDNNPNGNGGDSFSLSGTAAQERAEYLAAQDARARAEAQARAAMASGNRSGSGGGGGGGGMVATREANDSRQRLVAMLKNMKDNTKEGSRA